MSAQSHEIKNAVRRSAHRLSKTKPRVLKKKKTERWRYLNCKLCRFLRPQKTNCKKKKRVIMREASRTNTRRCVGGAQHTTYCQTNIVGATHSRPSENTGTPTALSISSDPPTTNENIDKQERHTHAQTQQKRYRRCYKIQFAAVSLGIETLPVRRQGLVWIWPWISRLRVDPARQAFFFLFLGFQSGLSTPTSKKTPRQPNRSFVWTRPKFNAGVQHHSIRGLKFPT